MRTNGPRARAGEAGGASSRTQKKEVIRMAAMRRFTCYDCKETFEVPYGTGVPGRSMECPKCGGINIHRAEGDRGFERGAGRGGARADRPQGATAGASPGVQPGGGSGAGRGPSDLGRGRGGAGRGPRWA